MGEKIFVTPEGNATFVCPVCGVTKVQNVEKFMALKTVVRIRASCKCGHSYPVTMERRKFVRKPCQLAGVFRSTIITENRGLMTVVDLSRSGMKIRLTVNQKLLLGEELEVEFRLDDAEQNLVRRDVTVRSVDTLDVGLEFKSLEHFDKLGVYLAFA